MKNKKAEIGTIVMMAVLVIVSVIAFGSSNSLTKKQTVNTQAATSCTIGSSNCGSGGNRLCTADNGCNPAICSTQYLEYACCVENYNSCSNGNNKFRWYGCTGQPCGNTIISQGSSGPGKLTACPTAVNSSNPDSCPAVANTPIPTSPPVPVPTAPVGNLCEKDGKGVCVEKLFNNNVQNCNDYNPGSQPFNRSCGESSDLVCCSNLDYRTPTTPPNSPIPTATKIPIPTAPRTTPGVTNPAVTETTAPVPPTSTPIATPTLNPSNVCTNLECQDPHLGLWYSYKCGGVPQTIRGVIQCPSFDFYGGKDCKTTVKSEKSIEEMEASYCPANYVDLYAKRNIIINYNFTISTAIDINPNNPNVSISITNGSEIFALALFPEPKIPNTHVNNFPLKGTTSVRSGTNIICFTVSYLDRNSDHKYLSICPVNVVNSKVDISADVSSAK